MYLGTTRLFLNGLHQGSWVDSTNYLSSDLLIGGSYAASSSVTRFINGYMDEIRITKGVGRYVSNYTPAMIPFSLN